MKSTTMVGNGLVYSKWKYINNENKVPNSRKIRIGLVAFCWALEDCQVVLHYLILQETGKSSREPC